MTLRSLASILIALSLAGCAKDATVTVLKPHMAPELHAPSVDQRAQQLIDRALGEQRHQPIAALGSLVEAVEICAAQLERRPSDVDARHTSNFAVSRIMGILRQSKLTP